MRELLPIYVECTKELDELGIRYGRVKNVVPNNRFKRKWGRCVKKVGELFYTIEISSVLLEESVPVQKLKETIHHELLHTVKGCDNHGATWKYYANKVNQAYGYDITRCSSSEKKGVPKEVVLENAKYVLRCTECGKLFIRNRMNELVQHPEYVRCASCYGKIERIK